MRHLTLAALVMAAAVAAASPAAADPTSTEPSAPATPQPTSEVAAPSETAAPTETATPTETVAPSETVAPTATSTSTPATPTVSAGAHQVTYTITTTSDLIANIYYVSADPPSQAKANDPQFMPMARLNVGPGAPWTFQTTLNNPNQWAFVSASGGLRVNPEFHCEIAVDGQVVTSAQGGSGVQCALRPW